MKIPSILEKFNVNPRKNASCLCFQLTGVGEICVTSSSIFSRGVGLRALINLDRIFLPLFRILPRSGSFFGNLIFAIIARLLCGNHLIEFEEGR